jgi:hypothetical protein
MEPINLMRQRRALSDLKNTAYCVLVCVQEAIPLDVMASDVGPAV